MGTTAAISVFRVAAGLAGLVERVFFGAFGAVCGSEEPLPFEVAAVAAGFDFAGAFTVRFAFGAGFSDRSGEVAGVVTLGVELDFLAIAFQFSVENDALGARGRNAPRTNTRIVMTSLKNVKSFK